VRHQVRVRDQHPRRIGVGAEDAHRFAGLDQERFIIAQILQARDDVLVALPVARGPADAAVDLNQR